MGTAVTPHELKGYQSQLAKAKAEVEVLNAAVIAAQKRYALAQKEVVSLEKKIAELQASSEEPIISEHALLRWMERIEGVDLDVLRRRILDEPTIASIKFARSGKLMKSGHALIFKNNTVVTVE